MACRLVCSLAVAATITLVVAKEWKALVVLKGDSGVSGTVTFAQYKGNGPVTVKGTIKGLAKGKHGFHIHDKGDISAGCGSTMGHFNPDKKNHGAPEDKVRHAGDLGNIIANEYGVTQVNIVDLIISVDKGKYNILGRAVVVHSDPYDLGKGGFSDSLTTGHAGSRVACGVIGVL